VRKVYYRRYRQRRAAKKRLAIFILFIVTFVITIVFIRSLLSRTTPNNQSVQSATITSEAVPSQTDDSKPPPLKRTNSQLLGEVIQSSLSGTHGEYGILVQNLKTNEFYTSNEHTEFYSASLYKLWVMLTVFEQINLGILSKDTILSQDVAVLNKKFNIGSESAELTEGTIKISIEEALKKMIVISDNYSALLLTEKVKLTTIDSVLKKNGLFESELGKKDKPPTTTPYDMGLFFEKLYSGQLADKKTTDEMIGLLKAQRLNDKIPKYLPDDIIVAHKTGELDEYSHDAGIIYTPEHDYILIILTKSDDPEAAEIRIANISQGIYGYFNHN